MDIAQKIYDAYKLIGSWPYKKVTDIPTGEPMRYVSDADLIKLSKEVLDLRADLDAAEEEITGLAIDLLNTEDEVTSLTAKLKTLEETY